MRHGKAADNVGGVLAFGALVLQELEPRRRGEEQVAYLNPGALALRRRLDRAYPSTLDRNAPAIGGAIGATGNRQPAYRTDRRQRLAAKAEPANVGQIIGRQFRGGMPFDGKGEIARFHAAAVVDHGDQRLAASGEGDGDPRGPGIDGVFDQFLDRTGRPLHHLAGGDAVGGGLGQAANRPRPDG